MKFDKVYGPYESKKKGLSFIRLFRSGKCIKEHTFVSASAAKAAAIRFRAQIGKEPPAAKDEVAPATPAALDIDAKLHAQYDRILRLVERAKTKSDADVLRVKIIGLKALQDLRTLLPQKQTTPVSELDHRTLCERTAEALRLEGYTVELNDEQHQPRGDQPTG